VQTPPLSQITQATIILLGAIALAYFARPVILPLAVAWIGAMALKPPVSWLRARHFPAPLAAAVVVAVLVSGLGCGAYYLSRPASEWIKSAPETLPRLKQKYQNVFRPMARLSEVASSVTSPVINTNASPAPAPPARVPAVENGSLAGKVFSWTGSAAAGIGETIALLFMLLASGVFFSQRLVSLMPTLQDKKRALEISHTVQQSISRYLFFVGLINVGLGMVVGSALYFLKMPNAALWGTVVMLFNFVPYFGPIVGIIAVALAGLVSFDSIGAGLAPAAAYLALHLLEANIVTPYALGHQFTMRPVILFIFVIFFLWLWGMVGAFVAMPVVVTLKVVCDRVNALSPLGEVLSK